MPKRRDPSPPRPSCETDEAASRPEQAAVERALEQVVERLRPKPPVTKPAAKGKPRSEG